MEPTANMKSTASSIALTFINGNISTAIAAIEAMPTPVEAAAMAMSVLRELTIMVGKDEALRFMKAVTDKAVDTACDRRR